MTTSPPLGLDEKVAMISGGSRGLGAALARRYGEEGAAVSLCARSEDELGSVRRELAEEGISCLAVPADVTRAGQVEAWRDATLERFGKVDVLVNNASILGPRVPIETYPEDAWRSVVEVNLTGAYLCARSLLAPLARTGGSIINVSSGVGDHGRPEWGAYCVSKNGLEALSELLAGEVREDGIRVNAVDPGSMRTDMRAAAYPEEDPGTLPTPYEVTDVFVYLASDESREITAERFRAQEFDIAWR